MNSILLTFRRIKKNKTTSTLGIAGLVVGLICFMYIFFWVTYETNFDRFHAKLDRIFVVQAYLDGGSKRINFGGCPPAVGPALRSDYPEVENSCRYISADQEFLVSYGENRFMEKTAFSDFALFDIFSFPFISGNQGEANIPNRIVLTQKSAAKYFGNSNPIGKLVHFDNKTDLIVVGIVRDFPQNSSITFDAVIPLENMSLYYPGSNFLLTWYNCGFKTYGLLTSSTGYDKVASTITNRIQKEIHESNNHLRTYKLKDEYLIEYNNIRNVLIFSLIAFLVLLSATLNFINLSTARSYKQAKATGLRKAIGASQLNLVWLAYSDVALVCFLAFAIAILAAIIGLPLFDNFIGLPINYSLLFSWRPLLSLIVIYLFTVLFSGSYPAFSLLKFSPAQTLNSNFHSTKNRGYFRTSLVVVIFVVSIVLLASTVVILKQTRFLQQMDLGFEKDQLIYVNLRGKLKDKASVLKEEVTKSSEVLSASVVSHLPNFIWMNGDGWNWEGKDPNFKPLVTEWRTDQDLLKTFGARMLEGNFFESNQEGVVINKAFADLIGWKSFAGKSLNSYGNQIRILGVINNIHFNSISRETQPLAMQMVAGSLMSNYLIIKINTGQILETLRYIQNVCKSIEPDVPVDYGFINDQYKKMLYAEMNLNKLVGLFSCFAMVVLCLGLLGVVMFMAEQKIKEIGIRKCFGETVVTIVGRFVKPFLISGFIALFIAIPFTWFFMDRWLQNYASHIQLNFWIFFSAGLFVVVMALFTVSWQSWKAATRNPVEALRYE